MRILQVMSALKQRSGVAHVLMNYYRVIDRTRVQFDFLTVEYDDSLKEEVEHLGGKVYTMEKLCIRRAAAFSGQLENFFSRHTGEYKIVHSHFYQIDFLLFPVAKKYGATHCVMHSHNTKYADYIARKVRNWVLSKLSCKHATDFAACSREAGAFLFGKYITAQGKLFVLNNAVDTRKFMFDQTARDSLRQQLGVSDKYVIGHVGRFCEQKNHEFLIRMFAQYTEKDENAILLLIGEGELEEAVKEQTAQMGISDRVLFLGRRADVPALLQAMDCFVLPSRYEGLPVSIVEAQAVGLPCATSSEVSRDAAVTELLQFFPLTELQPWIDWIAGVKNAERGDTRDLLIANGYDLDTQAGVLEDYYTQLVKG